MDTILINKNIIKKFKKIVNSALNRDRYMIRNVSIITKFSNDFGELQRIK
jgi:hypothetical protein